MSNYIYLVTVGLETPIYLVDAHRDWLYEGNNYIAGKTVVDNSVIQKAIPSAADFSITFSAVDQTMVSAFADHNYKGRPLLIQKAYLDDSENITNVETYLDGDISKYSYINSTKSSEITISATSIFGALDKTNKMNLRRLFSDSINDDATLYWGKHAAPVDVNN